MLFLETISNEQLIAYLTKINGKLPSNEYLISITGSEDTAIITEKFNVLPVVFDNELYGPRVLSFSDAFRIFRFIRNKVIVDARKLAKTTLYIACSDGLTLSGAIAQWFAEYIDKTLLDAKYFETRNLFIEPSVITQNKMYLVQLFFEEFILPTENLPATAARLLENPNASSITKKSAEEYLTALFINEKNLLVKSK